MIRLLSYTLLISLLAFASAGCALGPVMITPSSNPLASFEQYKQVFATEEYDQLYNLLDQESKVNSLKFVASIDSELLKKLSKVGYVAERKGLNNAQQLGAFVRALMKIQPGERKRIMNLKALRNPFRTKTRCRIRAKASHLSKPIAFNYILEEGVWKLRSKW